MWGTPAVPDMRRARMSKLRYKHGSLETEELGCLLGLTLTTLVAKPGRYGAIDPNKICQMFLFRRSHERKDLSQYEDAQIQDILADRERQFVVVAYDGVDKYDPEAAIIQQRVR